jgi:ABC-type multidrug transport system permease subunit
MFKLGPEKPDKRPIAVWHAPDDARGKQIVQGLEDSPLFAPKLVATADEVGHAVADETYIAGLVIPPDFQPTAKPIVLYIDLTKEPAIRGPINGALIGVVMRSLAPSGLAQPVFVATQLPPGDHPPPDEISSFQVTVPGNAVLFAFFVSMAVAISFAHERHTGTWRRMLAAPVSRSQVLVGKLVPYFLISVIQQAFLFGLGTGLFGMKVAGSVPALLILTAAVSMCSVSFGLLVASFGGTERQIGSTVPIAILVMGLLGGCMFPRMFMPAIMKSIGHAVPHSWALDGYYAVLIKAGTTIGTIAPELCALLAFAGGFALVGLWRFRFER